MGDQWLQTLTQGGVVAAVSGLIVWLLRWIVRREREISGQWQATAERAQTTSEATLAALERQGQVLREILAALDRLGGTGRHSAGSWAGSSGYDETNGGPGRQPPMR